MVDAAHPSDGEVPPGLAPGGVSNASVAQAFHMDNAGVISLVGVPQTDNPEHDLLVALMLGYRDLAKKTRVLGGALKKGARQTGFPIERPSAYLAKSSYVNVSGSGRSKGYSLKNEGIRYASRVAGQLLAGGAD